MFTKPSEKVKYCYGIYQQLYDQMERKLSFVTFHSGLPDVETLNDLASDYYSNLVILNDLMDSVTSSLEKENLFVKGMHHRLKNAKENSRAINLNTHILVLIKNPQVVLSVWLIKPS